MLENNLNFARYLVDKIEESMEEDRENLYNEVIFSHPAAQPKTGIMKEFAKENGIPIVDFPLANDPKFMPFGSDTDEDGFVTVYMTEKG